MNDATFDCIVLVLGNYDIYVYLCWNVVPGAQGAGGARAGVVQLLGVGLQRAHRQLPRAGHSAHAVRALLGRPRPRGARPVRGVPCACAGGAAGGGPLGGGGGGRVRGVRGVGDDDAVVVADHDHRRHAASSALLLRLKSQISSVWFHFSHFSIPSPSQLWRRSALRAPSQVFCRDSFIMHSLELCNYVKWSTETFVRGEAWSTYLASCHV